MSNVESTVVSETKVTTKPVNVSASIHKMLKIKAAEEGTTVSKLAESLLAAGLKA
jgi:hypothetical protein